MLEVFASSGFKMAQLKYTLQQRMFMYDSYVITSSCREVVRQFQTKFPGERVPSRETVRLLVNKLRDTGSILDKKRNVKRRVLTEDKLDDIGERLERSPKKSLRRLAQETEISKYSAWKATKLLKLKPYKVTVVQQLLPHDNAARLNFCNWILDNVNDQTIDPRLIFFTDEAWFHLHGYVSSQNNRYYATEKPNFVHETPLHDQKIGVWCAISGYRIIGPIFYDDTINAERYRNLILEPFFEQLTDIECRSGYFQQDSATAHTANLSLNLIAEFFEDRVISTGLWPARSPDLTVCDFYLWGNLKNKVYKSNPHTLEELKQNIRTEINAISEAELLRVNGNFLKRCRRCIDEEGRHFQHLL